MAVLTKKQIWKIHVVFSGAETLPALMSNQDAYDSMRWALRLEALRTLARGK